MSKAVSPGCAICGRPVVAEHRPFCSARCRRVDLGRWLGESYRIPAAETDDPDEDDELPRPDGPGPDGPERDER